MFDREARADFSRARRKALYQKIRSWFSGKTDNLLPYDQVREAIPIRGQRYIGLQAIPIDRIVGSMGRYHEFNRAFLPTQSHTQQRWVKIGKAHYEDVHLPPIEVYKLGEIYFVRDGNHRVSVGREYGKAFIDAFVTEIDIPVSLTPDSDISDLAMKRESVRFLEKTGLLDAFPDVDIEVTLPGEVRRLFEHIETHRYYLGLKLETEPSYGEAVRSWYTEVYQPLAEEMTRQGLSQKFPSLTTADLYLLVSEYQWLLREAYQDATGLAQTQQHFTQSLEKISPQALLPGQRITRALRNAPWLDDFIMRQEQEAFLEQTGLDLHTTKPGASSKILQHIHDHRWFLGIDRDGEVRWDDAVSSWHENIYLPIRDLVRELDILSHFPDRTETDFYLWIIDHRAEISERQPWELPAEVAARDLVQSLARTDDNGAATTSDQPVLSSDDGVFKNLMVPLSDDEGDLTALEQALIIAQRNQGRLFGLHVISEEESAGDEHHDALRDRFHNMCSEYGVSGDMAFEKGSVARQIALRARWMDLIVMTLKYPPGGSRIAKFSSGFRYVLRRSAKPVLAVPRQATQLQNILLAYDGSHLADEALYIASRFAAESGDTQLTVLTAGARRSPTATRLSRAEAFLDARQIPARYVRAAGSPENAIAELIAKNKHDLVIMGGYGDSPLLELAIGSTLDGVLEQSEVPVLIRT